MNRYNITFSINKPYLLFAFVTLYSILDNNKNSFFTIYILHNNCISNNDMSHLISKLPSPNFSINLIDVSNIKEITDLKEIGVWTKEIFFKVFLPVLLPNIDKVMHIDADVICKGDITKLYETPMRDYIFLGDTNNKYLNVGILVINLKLAREEKVTEQLVSYIQDNNTIEEIAINKLFADKILSCTKGYILTTFFYKKGSKPSFHINDTKFIHYTGNKPYYIEKSTLIFNRQAINIYYKYMKYFINENKKFQFFWLHLYITNLALYLHSYYRRITTLINKILKRKIPTRVNFVFNKITEYSKIK